MNIQKYLLTHLPCLSWEYEGYVSTNPNFYEVQNDWNQTLCTKINQLSAMILKDSMTGGANLIIIPENKIKDIFLTLEYLKVNEIQHVGYYELGVLAGRYHVCVVPDIDKITIEKGEPYAESMQFDISKFFVCKVRDIENVLDAENYLKVGTIEIMQ